MFQDTLKKAIIKTKEINRKPWYADCNHLIL
jgi:hypothetical protein